MSLQISAAVWRLDVEPKKKLLLLALADYADAYGISWPGMAKLSQHTCIPERTLQRILKALIEQNVISVGWRYIGKAKVKAVRHYRLQLAEVPEMPEPNYENCSKTLREQVISVFGGVCEYCQKEGDEQIGPDGHPWQIDRVIPGFKGGKYTAENVCLSCKACNSKKWIRDAATGTRTMGAILAPQPAIEGAILDKDGCQNEQSGVPLVAPYPSENRHRTINPSPSAGDLFPVKTPDLGGSPVGRVFERWRDLHASPRAVLNDARRRMIQLRLKSYSEEDLLRAIEGYSKSPFHMGNNERNQKYNSLELILRNAEKIEAGMEFFANPPQPRGPKPEKARFDQDAI